ncbi:arginase family protein [Actinoplanes sp. TBRC 11911]|uniref:arginase family protein n=1 Tax=Actinoplanes sp. TBRC 11911 TaxID=2729386 RepID=UPI00145EB184|nr:arginase family protein [Actinoplanes sp. TBRC 11911]NMO53918.1 arginase family protein [Actinoplanes sp. TBRC 11911]
MSGTGWFLLGAPWDCSGTGRGEMRAPEALRAAGLTGLADLDLGDAATVISDSRRDAATGVLALTDTIAAAGELAAALRAGIRDHPARRPLIIGGDCSLLLGVFAGLPGLADEFDGGRDGAVGLWMVDGHPDYLDAAGSDTGETADLELALLTGDGPESLVTLGGRVPMVAARHVALIGHRTSGLDAAAAAELARVPGDMLALDARAVVGDPRATGRRAAAWAARLRLPMWLHVDVDVLDPSAMPAVTYPQAGGPDLDQLAALLTPLAAAPDLIGVSVADFRPDLDPDGRYAARLVGLLERILSGD